ncbi:MAG TPA: hypothetical protein VG897_08305 [Terriglobales bacterium]|nr:hypothetical protein [Terriglobales bacterium]
MSLERQTVKIAACTLILLLSISTNSRAQTAPATSQQIDQVLQQIEILNGSLRDMRNELDTSRAEIRELKSTVEALEARLAKESSANSVPSGEPPVTRDDVQILTERVEEHQQTKVESASRFRVKLSGMVLLNAFSNFGQVDNIDLPSIALPHVPGTPDGSTGASMRQSIVGITGFGPELLGARTSADLQMDFFGGFPPGYNGISSGIVRLRIARLRFDWPKTSLVGGIDIPFFSPNSPTSYATVGEPAMSSTGNLWAWNPSIRVEHHFDYENSRWKVEAGVFDPSGYAGYAPQMRYPTAGESSRQPAYAVRVSGSHGESEHEFTIGVAGLFTPLHFYSGPKVNGAGVMADWQAPLGQHLQLNGEFFSGKGLQAFGGVPYSMVSAQDELHYLTITAPLLAGVGEIGGWSQLKLKLNSKQEFNVAAGYGGYNSSELRELGTYDYYANSLITRNESVMVNYILRPRSDLLLSAEYRRLRTSPVRGTNATADQVGLAAGFLF